MINYVSKDSVTLCNKIFEAYTNLSFLPFEQEFFNIRRTLFSFEDEFEWLSNASNLIEIYKDYYPILTELTTKKGYVFLRLTPLIHEIRDDFKKVEECLSMLLDCDSSISLSFKKNTVDSYTPPELGFAALGINTVIGSCIEDGEPDLDIVLAPMHSLEQQDYGFFDNKMRLAELLCDFFAGAQYNVSISYALDGDEYELALDDSALLGYAYL